MKRCKQDEGLANTSPSASAARASSDIVSTTARLTWDGLSWVPEWE